MNLPQLSVTLLLLLPLPALAKPPTTPAAHASESTNLKRARATVDKMTARLTTMIKQAEAPGVDLAKVQALVNEFQSHVAAQRAESDAVEKLLSDDEKAEVGRYIAEKVTPLLGRFETVYKRVQNEADPQREERQKALLVSVETLGKEAEAALALAKDAGQDPGKRAAVIAKLEQLGATRHTLYHAGATEVQASSGREQWEALFTAQVERPLLRSERLLRMALQTPSTEFLQAQKQVAELTKQTDALHGEWHAVQDWPGLKVLQDREAALQKSVQALALGWRLLATDEAVELDAMARETLVPAVERMTHDSVDARKRLPAEPEK